MSFSWVPFYEELATKLLAYEHRQRELCEIRITLSMAGLKPGFTEDQRDRSGTTAPLEVMDPFTMFATFNRGQDNDGTTQRRFAIANRLKSLLGLRAAAPTDFDGVPLVDNQKSAFFPWLYKRKPEDLPTLWRLARQAIEGGRAAIQETAQRGTNLFPKDFKHDLAEDLSERPDYRLRDISRATAEDFRSVYA